MADSQFTRHNSNQVAVGFVASNNKLARYEQIVKTDDESDNNIVASDSNDLKAVLNDITGAIKFKGNWVSGTVYAVGDVVDVSGVYFRCVSLTSIDWSAMPTNNTNWKLTLYMPTPASSGALVLTLNATRTALEWLSPTAAAGATFNDGDDSFDLVTKTGSAATDIESSFDDDSVLGIDVPMEVNGMTVFTAKRITIAQLRQYMFPQDWGTVADDTIDNPDPNITGKIYNSNVIRSPNSGKVADAVVPGSQSSPPRQPDRRAPQRSGGPSGQAEDVMLPPTMNPSTNQMG